MKISFKQMLGEFKAFAFKGNMIDLAVAVVIGTAFSGVISSLVKDIIMPSISYVTTAAADAADAAKHAAKEAGALVSTSTHPSTPQSSTAPSTTQPAAAPAVVTPPPPPPPAPAAEPQPVDINWKIGRIQIGKFIGELLNFVLIAFAVFLLVVKLLGSVMKRVGGTPAATEVTTKECPRCLSIIPIRATRCSSCTSDLPEVIPPPLGG